VGVKRGVAQSKKAKNKTAIAINCFKSAMTDTASKVANLRGWFLAGCT